MKITEEELAVNGNVSSYMKVLEDHCRLAGFKAWFVMVLVGTQNLYMLSLDSALRQSCHPHINGFKVRHRYIRYHLGAVSTIERDAMAALLGQRHSFLWSSAESQLQVG